MKEENIKTNGKEVSFYIPVQANTDIVVACTATELDMDTLQERMFDDWWQLEDLEKKRLKINKFNLPIMS